MFFPYFIDELDIAFLYIGRIGQHNIGEVHGCRGAVYIAVKSLLDQVRQVTKMVNVGMRYDHIVQGSRVEVEIEVTLIGLCSATLEHATIQQEMESVYIEEVTGAGDVSDGTVKGEFNQ